MFLLMILGNWVAPEVAGNELFHGAILEPDFYENYI
jgi:hypothetical protein